MELGNAVLETGTAASLTQATVNVYTKWNPNRSSRQALAAAFIAGFFWTLVTQFRTLLSWGAFTPAFVSGSLIQGMIAGLWAAANTNLQRSADEDNQAADTTWPDGIDESIIPTAVKLKNEGKTDA